MDANASEPTEHTEDQTGKAEDRSGSAISELRANCMRCNTYHKFTWMSLHDCDKNHEFQRHKSAVSMTI